MNKLSTDDMFGFICVFGFFSSIVFGFASLITIFTCDTRLTAHLISLDIDKNNPSNCYYNVSYEWSGNNFTSWVVQNCPYNSSAIDEINICFSRRKPLSISPGNFDYISATTGTIIYICFYISLMLLILPFFWVILSPLFETVLGQTTKSTKIISKI